MKSIHKLIAMLFIWGAFTLASMAAVVDKQIDVGNVIIVLFFVVAALAATRFVTDAPLDDEDAVAKVKQTRVDRVLESLNDDELNALRDRLADGDGEIVSLDEVMRRQRKDRG